MHYIINIQNHYRSIFKIVLNIIYTLNEKWVSHLFNEAVDEYQNSQNLWVLGIFLSCLGNRLFSQNFAAINN